MAGTIETYGTLMTGSIIAKVISTDEIAAKKAAITDALSAIEFAAEKGVFTQSLASKEFASQDIALANFSTDAIIDDDPNTPLPQAILDKTYMINVNNDNSSFNIRNIGTDKVFDLSSSGKLTLDDISVLGTLDATITESNLDQVKSLTLDTLNVDGLSNFKDVTVTGNFQGTIEVSDLASVKSLTLDTLNVGNIHGTVGVFDELAATSVAVSDALSTIQFAAQEAIVTESLAATEISARDIALAAINIGDHSSQSTVNIEQSYKLAVASDNSLHVTKGESNVLEISETTAKFPGDVSVTGKIIGDVNDNTFDTLVVNDLTVNNSINTKDMVASGNIEADSAKIGVVASGNIEADVAAIDTLASRAVAVTHALSAIEIAAQTISATEAVATKEIATQLLQLASVNVENDSNTPLLSEENTYKLEQMDGNLVISKGNVELLEIAD